MGKEIPTPNDLAKNVDKSAPDGEESSPAGESSSKGDWPANTPLAEMTVEQREAYHRYHSRKHEQAEKDLRQQLDARSDYDQIKAELEQLRQSGMSEAERAAEEAREQARREGENLGAARYIRAAVRGETRAILAAKGLSDSDESVKTAVESLVDSLDHTKLLDGQGEVDAGKLAAMIAPLIGEGPGRGDESQQRDSYSDSIRRSRQASGSTGSIAALKTQYAQKYAPNTKD